MGPKTPSKKRNYYQVIPYIPIYENNRLNGFCSSVFFLIAIALHFALGAAQHIKAV